MAGLKETGKTRVSAEQFIEVWQTSRTLDEAADRLGITTEYATCRASLLRQQYDVPLRMMKRRAGIDWDALRKKAKTLGESFEEKDG
jgi:hypothetical protein